jgi:hypothetical protein
MGGPIWPSGGQGEARSLLCDQSLLCDSRKLVTPHPRVTHEQSERWAIGAPTAQRGREGAERASRHSPVTWPSLPCHRALTPLSPGPHSPVTAAQAPFGRRSPSVRIFGPDSPRTSISPHTRSAQRPYRFHHARTDPAQPPPVVRLRSVFPITPSFLPFAY